MSSNYEMIRYNQGLSANIIVHRVNRYKLHWHKEIEIILVLQGKVSVNVNNQKYELKEDDIFFINSNDIHSTVANGDNIMVAIQINPDFYYKTFPELQNMRFNFISSEHEEAEGNVYEQMRTYIAEIIKEYNKSAEGYQLVIEGILNSLMALFIRNIPKIDGKEKKGDLTEKDLPRIKRIMEYVEEHYSEKITLEDIAKNEFLSLFYVSHFFKDKVGLTFQEYLSFVRLHKAVAMLGETDKLISDIAIDNGFPSVKAFNKVFRDFYEVTPSEYRKSQSFNLHEKNDRHQYMEFDSIKAMNKLQEYLKRKDEGIRESKISRNKGIITCNIDSSGESLNHYWKKLMTVGRAYDCLRADLQEQIKEAVKEIGFEYIRFHGVFSDEMRVLSQCHNGIQSFNWSYVDKVIDFFRSINLHPFLDFTFMPTEFASSDVAVFWYKGNISMPKDLGKWTEMVDSFIRHCINRYGIKEVRLWYFEIWNEPDYMWTGSEEEFQKLYRETVKTMLNIDEDLRIAGPSILQSMEVSSPWLNGFIKFLNEDDLNLNYFTYHLYGERDIYQNVQGEIISMLGHKDHVVNCVKSYEEELKKLKNPVKEVHITEFNLSARHGNYLQDTMFTACHVIYNALRNIGKLDSLGFWTISDIFEEDDYILPPFSGGFGMMTAEGIKKPAYYAYYFLSQLGNQIIYQGDDYIITRHEDDIQILAYNYLFYDKVFQNGDYSMLDFQNRYEVFEEKPPIDLSFNLSGLKGNYCIREQKMDRSLGSAFDIYQQMGSPEELSKWDIDYLKGMARPQIKVCKCSISGEFTQTVHLEPHGIALIIFEKQY